MDRATTPANVPNNELRYSRSESAIHTPLNRFWQWMLKAGFSILDQGFLSTSNFVLNVVLARILPREEYGAFSVAFTIFLVIAGIHNALLIEPMSVLGPARHLSDINEYIRRVIWVHVGLMGGIVILSGGIALLFRTSPLGPAMLSMSVSSLFILLFWLVRRAHYLEIRPDLAAGSSGVYCASLAVIAFIAWRLGVLTAAGGFVAMALAGLVATLFSMWRFGLGFWPGIESALRCGSALKEHWDFGRWVLPSALFYPLLSQIQLFLTSAYVGLSAAGVFRAIQNPILPVMQVITALATLAVPVLSMDFSTGRIQIMQRRALIYTGVMTLIAVAYEATVLGGSDIWDRLLYNGRYSSSEWLMPILGLMPIAFAVATGCSVLLRAIQRPELTTITHVCGGIFGAGSAYILIRQYGLAGAVYGLVAAHAVTAAVSVILAIGVRGTRPATGPIPSLATGS